MKVLFVTNIPSPYRMDFFNLLGNHVDLTVAFTDEPARTLDRESEWFGVDYRNFRPVFLKKRIFGNVCADILPLLREGWEHIILGGYAEPSIILAIEYMRLRHIPFLIEMDGSSDRRGEKKAKYLLKRHLNSAASGWISSGGVTTERLAYYGAKRENVYQYPFTSLLESDVREGASLTAETKRLAREKIGATEKKIVLYVGQFIPRKGIDLLLRASKDFCEDVGVYIVGGEPTEEYLRIQEELSLRHIHFVGFQRKEALKDYYRAADVFVLPTRGDVWGLVVNEALSFGLPVVSTDKCVAALELIGNGGGRNGFIVPANDSAALGEAIQKVLSGDAAAFRRAALDSIKDYTIENMVFRHLEIFRDVDKRNARST